MNQLKIAIAILLITIFNAICGVLLNATSGIIALQCCIGICLSLAFFLLFGKTVEIQSPFCFGAVRIRNGNIDQFLAGCRVRMTEDYLSLCQSKFQRRIHRDDICDAVAVNHNTVDFYDIHGNAYRLVMMGGVSADMMAEILNERVPF